jgi:hexosaminidase
VLWSSSYRDYDNFTERLVEAQHRLDYGKINYHIPLPEGPQAQYVEFVDSMEVELFNTLNYDIYYTLDDTYSKVGTRHAVSANSEAEKDNNSSFFISHSSFLKSFTTFNGRNSDTIEVCYNKLSAPHPAAKGLSQNGLYRQRAYGYFPNTDSLDYVKFDVTDLVDSLVYDYNDTYFTSWIEVYQGYIKVDSTTTYLITTDLEELWVDDIRVINNNGRLKRNQTQRAQMVLESGYHSIKAVYNNCVNDGFPAHWRKPEIRIKAFTDKDFRVLKPKDFYR